MQVLNTPIKCISRPFLSFFRFFQREPFILTPLLTPFFFLKGISGSTIPSKDEEGKNIAKNNSPPPP